MAEQGDFRAGQPEDVKSETQPARCCSKIKLISEKYAPSMTALSLGGFSMNLMSPLFLQRCVTKLHCHRQAKVVFNFIVLLQPMLHFNFMQFGT